MQIAEDEERVETILVATYSKSLCQTLASKPNKERKSMDTLGPIRWSLITIIYFAMAIVGFTLPMICFGYHFGSGMADAWPQFFAAPWLTWATAGFSWDLFITATTLVIWICAESRRLSMRGVGWNLAIVFLVGMSFALSVFLLRREWQIQNIAKSLNTTS